MAKVLGLGKDTGKRIRTDEILKQNERQSLKNSNQSIKSIKIVRQYYHTAWVCVCVCVCVCVYFVYLHHIYTISITLICVSQEEPSLIPSN